MKENTALSPEAEAQVVLDAANGACSYGPDDCLNESRWIAAAAIRAAADQVVPEEPILRGDQRWMLEHNARQASRRKLLAIATELEGSN